jgi:hypothetical protein
LDAGGGERSNRCAVTLGGIIHQSGSLLEAKQFVRGTIRRESRNNVFEFQPPFMSQRLRGVKFMQGGGQFVVVWPKRTFVHETSDLPSKEEEAPCACGIATEALRFV